MDWLSSVTLKMEKVATIGSMGFVYKKEGSIALAASKPTAIALMWDFLDEGRFKSM